MKKLNYLSLILLFAAVLFSACEPEKNPSGPQDDDKGQLFVTLKVDRNEITKAGAGEEVFSLRVKDRSNNEIAFYEDYPASVEGKPILLPAGQYRIEAFTPSYENAGWGIDPYFAFAYKDIKAKEDVRLTLNVKRYDCKFDLQVDDDLKSLYPHFYIYLSNDKGAVLNYDSDKPVTATRASFPVSGRLKYEFQMFDAEGNSYDYEADVLTNVKAGEVYQLKISLPSAGQLGILSVNGRNVDMMKDESEDLPDFDVVKQRLIKKKLYNPNVKTVKSCLDKLQADGTFSGVDYADRNHDMRSSHLAYLYTLAAAYSHPDNKDYYQNETVAEAYLLALEYWVDNDPVNSNWWYRYIAYPQKLSDGVILMEKEIKSNRPLFKKLVDYLRWAYDKGDAGHKTGANGADVVAGAWTADIITRNAEHLRNMRDFMDRLLCMQHGVKGDGIHPDYMYSQHSDNGRQMYVMGYGKEYLDSTVDFLELFEGTCFRSEGVDLLQRYMYEGVQWIFFNTKYDPNQTGRGIRSEGGYEGLSGFATRLGKLSGECQDKMDEVARHINGENTLEGNRMFWRFDYMIHRRQAYMATTRMTSDRTVGNEAGTAIQTEHGVDYQGKYNYYSCNGVNYIFVTGREYGGNYFTDFNYRQFPGTTAEQDNAELPRLTWGKNGNNGSSYAGGASDGSVGVCGMILSRRGVKAHKAWFYFDEEFVCLGADISETGGTAAVYTNINQSNIDGGIIYSDNGKQASGTAVLSKPEWVHHGQIGYFNLCGGTAAWHISRNNNIFSLNVNHGENPKAGSYAYLVKPSMSSAEAAGYYDRLPVTVLSNTSLVQAVRHNELKLTEFMFYQSGSLDFGEGQRINVSAPCAVLWDENTGKLTVGNPRCESNNPKTVTVTLNGDAKVFTLPQDSYAGQSVTL